VPPTPKLPRLGPEILADDVALAEALDALTRDDRRIRCHIREILHRQQQLQVLADEETWSAYLHLEAAINARLVDLVGRIARWAFEQGREFERRAGRR
jgi:hypothetical protein